MCWDECRDVWRDVSCIFHHVRVSGHYLHTASHGDVLIVLTQAGINQSVEVEHVRACVRFDEVYGRFRRQTFETNVGSVANVRNVRLGAHRCRREIIMISTSFPASSVRSRVFMSFRVILAFIE